MIGSLENAIGFTANHSSLAFLSRVLARLFCWVSCTSTTVKCWGQYRRRSSAFFSSTSQVSPYFNPIPNPPRYFRRYRLATVSPPKERRRDDPSSFYPSSPEDSPKGR